MNNSQNSIRVPFDFTVDPRVFESRRLPERSLRRQLPRRAERRACSPTCRYSQKTFGFRGTGGTSTALNDSPFIGLSQLVHLQRAVLRRHRSGESRQLAGRRQPVVRPAHRQLRAATTSRAASRSSTAIAPAATRRVPPDYVFYADYLADAGGAPVLRPAGAVHPGVRPGCRASTRTGWRRAAPSSTSRTTSFYMQDRWRGHRHLSFDVGTRYEKRAGRGDGRHRHGGHRHVRAAPGRHLRPEAATDAVSRRRRTPGTPASTARAQFANNTHRRQPGPHRRVSLHRAGGAGPRLRARLRPEQLRALQRRVPDRQRLLRARACRRR